MGRIPDDEIERLKREISIESLVRARGVELTRQGANLLGRCPFHEDRTPSLVVTPDKGLWHCMGACQKGGSVIDWVMVAEGASFRHAIEILRGGGALERNPRDLVDAPKHSMRRKLKPLAEVDASEAELMANVVDVYHSTLKQSPEALAYLRSRGLDSPELIDRFKLGFSNRTLGYRLPPSQNSTGAALRGKLTELGVLRETGSEHLRGTLTCPLFDREGRVVQIYGRKIENQVARGVSRHLYLPGAHRGVFNREGIGVESDEVILCEAIIDALTFWSAGFRNVTTAYGIEGFTDEIAEALVEANIQVVKIAFDRDEAGDRGAEKVSAKLKALGIETQRVLFPKGMDANAYAMKVAPAEKSLRLVLERAEWMSKEPPAEAPSLVASPEPLSVAADAPEPAGVDEVLVQTTAAEIRAMREEESEEERDAENEPPRPADEPVSESPAIAEPVNAAPATESEKPKRAPKSRASEELEVEESENQVHFRIGDRHWQVELPAKPRAGEMRVNLRVTRGEGLYIDVLELKAARQRGAFARGAAEALELDESLVARELMTILLELEKRRDRKAKQASQATGAPGRPMTEHEREAALALLRDPKLLDRVLADLHVAGVVGEETNKLVGYLAATSRKLEEPLAVVIQSSSAAGKSSLMEAVLNFIPDEERVQYSAMTAQSLFYIGGQSLKHRVLAIVEEEGADRASYALKLLQSEGELRIASAGKDPVTGKHITHDYRVEGPVMIFLTTTAIEVDEELLNRCVVLSVDEGRAQTEAIHARQRDAETLEGLMRREESREIRRLHQNAQRLLRPLAVVNPFVKELRFTTHATRTRRDHKKYLTLIRAVALLHQHQRPVKSFTRGGEEIEYIEATREDVEIATQLGYAVLGRSLDELPPQTRRLLGEIVKLVAARVQKEGVEQSEIRFTRRELREWTNWGNTQLKVHMKRLEELEYLLMHRGRGGPVVHYELVYSESGKDGEILIGGTPTTRDRSGLGSSGRGLAGAGSGTGRGEAKSLPSEKKALNGHRRPDPSERRSVEVGAGAGS